MNLDEVLGKSLSRTREARGNPSSRARLSLAVPLVTSPKLRAGVPGTPDFAFGIMALPVACTRVASSGERPHQVSAPPGVSPGPPGGRDLELPRSKSTRLAKAGVGGCN